MLSYDLAIAQPDSKKPWGKLPGSKRRLDIVSRGAPRFISPHKQKRSQMYTQPTSKKSKDVKLNHNNLVMLALMLRTVQSIVRELSDCIYLVCLEASYSFIFHARQRRSFVEINHRPRRMTNIKRSFKVVCKLSRWFFIIYLIVFVCICVQWTMIVRSRNRSIGEWNQKYTLADTQIGNLYSTKKKKGNFSLSKLTFGYRLM